VIPENQLFVCVIFIQADEEQKYWHLWAQRCIASPLERFTGYQAWRE